MIDTDALHDELIELAAEAAEVASVSGRERDGIRALNRVSMVVDTWSELLRRTAGS